MITIIKRQRRNSTTYSRMELSDLYKAICVGLYDHELQLPEVCFASEIAKRKGVATVRHLNGLCHLEVHNLPSAMEVDEAMQLACAVPYSALVYRGRDGRSLHIVCRFDWKRPSDGKAPQLTEEQMLSYQRNAYKQLHYAYSVQLHISIDTTEPTLMQSTVWSGDADAYYNADSQPFFVQEGEVNVPAYVLPPTGRPDDSLARSENEYEDQSDRYQWCSRKALQESRLQVSCSEEQQEKYLSLLAQYCHESGIDMELAVKQTLWKSEFWERDNHVRLTFANAYDEKLNRLIPYGHVEYSALLMMRAEAYVHSRYDLRRNMLTGVVEYRNRSNYYYPFQPLTDEDLNSMTIEALKMGIGAWDKDLRRIVDSRDIPAYDPLYEYLRRLPKWDGRDHIAALCARIPTDTPRYEHYLRIWLRSMVAHWLGKDRRHGNALVPLLIGGQGCGKSTFCSLLLPRDLSVYYNDKVDFRSEGDIMAALSNYALINIDEFDSLKKSQQPVLKYLLSKSEVRFRPPFGRAIVERRRYASFIATTNQYHPLLDTTGSRRFACILVREGARIDFETPVKHKQLYAQILHEINEGARYWLNDEETAELQRQNAQFQHLADASAMIDATFCPVNDPVQLSDRKSPNWRSISEVIDILQQRYPYLLRTKNLNQHIGTLLSEKRYESYKSRSCMMYYVAMR